jgi:hypothetical protein
VRAKGLRTAGCSGRGREGVRGREREKEGKQGGKNPKPCAALPPTPDKPSANPNKNAPADGRGARVGDRTALILDIFSQRARTREGMLQARGGLVARGGGRGAGGAGLFRRPA